MSGTSSKTVPVMFRISVDLYDKLTKRVARKPGRWNNVNEYAKERFIKDANRKH